MSYYKLPGRVAIEKRAGLDPVSAFLLWRPIIGKAGAMISATERGGAARAARAADEFYTRSVQRKIPEGYNRPLDVSKRVAEAILAPGEMMWPVEVGGDLGRGLVAHTVTDRIRAASEIRRVIGKHPELRETRVLRYADAAAKGALQSKWLGDGAATTRHFEPLTAKEALGVRAASRLAPIAVAQALSGGGVSAGVGQLVSEAATGARGVGEAVAAAGGATKRPSALWRTVTSRDFRNQAHDVGGALHKLKQKNPAAARELGSALAVAFPDDHYMHHAGKAMHAKPVKKKPAPG
jgi:hypothetical protein